jgi:hypothetical protein
MFDGVRAHHDALPRRIEYRGEDDEDEEDEEDWGDNEDMMGGEDDMDEEMTDYEDDDGLENPGPWTLENDGGEQDYDNEGSDVEPSSKNKAKDVGLKSGVGPLPELSVAFREKDAGNNKISTADTTPTAVEKMAETAPVLPKLEFSGGRLLEPQSHEALHNDSNSDTADNKITDSKNTDSKTGNGELY